MDWVIVVWQDEEEIFPVDTKPPKKKKNFVKVLEFIFFLYLHTPIRLAGV